jgi:RNase adaptor protein for sRNA GlmZ degradation
VEQELKSEKAPRLAIVGPCASGKSTLATALKAAGYEVRQPAQEHSYVQAMWQQLTNPDVLIYLDVDDANILKRRPYVDSGPERLLEQRQRLSHARQHCDLYLDTSNLTLVQVRAQVLRFLHQFLDG